MHLQRLTYTCTNRIGPLGLPPASELKAILTAGHRNNAAAGITGGLIFNERHFVGVLEGDRRMVSALLLRVSRDKRCGDMTIMAAEPIDERRFDEWMTAYAGHSEAVDRIYLRYGIVQGLDPTRMTAESASRLVEALCRLDPKALARFAHAQPPETVEVIKVATSIAAAHRGHPVPA